MKFDFDLDRFDIRDISRNNMKSVSILTLLLILAAAGLGVKIFLEKQAETYDYPVHRTITSEDGRSLEVVIHGRSESMLSIERLSDGREFDWEISKLSAEDQEFAEKLALTTKDEILAAEREKSQQDSDSYIESRLKRIEDLQSRYEALEIEIASGSLTPSVLTNRRTQRDRIEQEIEELHSAIAQYKYRNKIE